MELTRSIITWLAIGATAVAGPYSDEYGGLHHATGACFRGWITGVVDYTQPDPYSGGLARADDGAITNAAGAVAGAPEDFSPESAAVHVLSLGNSGSIIVTFDDAIENGPGPDFAVFENAFTDYTLWGTSSRQGSTDSFCFAELAFVEVGSSTSSWARFPVTCLNTSVVYARTVLSNNYFSSQDVTLLDGFAGKHQSEYGTPFDLSALANDPAVISGDVDLGCIRYIRVTDAIGDGSTTDRDGRPIYDPYFDWVAGYPTAPVQSATDGFDLRAIGVINAVGIKTRPTPQGMSISWYAETGATYQVQWTPSLPGEIWSNVSGQVVGDDRKHSITDAAPAELRVYRVVEAREGGM